MTFGFDKNKTNSHGTQKPGEPWNWEMVRGWKLKWIKLERKGPGFSRRLILYFPDGSWWNFDVFSRRVA